MLTNVFSLAVRWGNRSTKLSIYHQNLIKKLHLGLNANLHLRQTNVGINYFIMNIFKSILDFGMYKGDTVASIFTHDAGYLKWAVSIGRLSFNKEDMERIEKKAKSESNAYYAEKYDGLSWGDFHV